MRHWAIFWWLFFLFFQTASQWFSLGCAFLRIEALTCGLIDGIASGNVRRDARRRIVPFVFGLEVEIVSQDARNYWQIKRLFRSIKMQNHAL